MIVYTDCRSSYDYSSNAMYVLKTHKLEGENSLSNQISVHEKFIAPIM